MLERDERLVEAVSGIGSSPSWIEVPPLRTVSKDLGMYLGSIEARMPTHHQYRSDRVGTWAHETTHGLNSRLRGVYAEGGGNALFIPPGFCCVTPNPRGMTLSQIAQSVPGSWRGMSYDLYLRQQVRWWNDTPTYVLDEWTAYTNGTLATNELKAAEPSYSDPLQMVEFMGYSLTLASMAPAEDQLVDFVSWYSRYTVIVSDHVAGVYDVEKAKNHLRTIRTSRDGESIRSWASGAYGDAWMREVLTGG